MFLVTLHSALARALADAWLAFRLGCLSTASGFFFTTSGGLRSYEHPMHEVKPVPRVDSKGEVCGTTYTVDATARKETSIPRVGSAADWSSQY